MIAMERLRNFRLLPKGEDWTAYAWLIYLVYFLATPFFFASPLWLRAATVAATLVATALNFVVYWLPGKQKLWAAGGFLVLGTAFCSVNPGASVLYVYAACCLAKVGSTATAFRYLGAILAIILAEAWLFQLNVFVWGSAFVFSALMGSVLIHKTQRDQLTGKLLVAREETERLAKIAERERIARDLHDLLGHTLSLIILKSELASRLAEKEPARAAQEIRDVERISREALAQVRSAVRGYRSAGFESEFREAHRTLETAGIRVEESVEPAALSPVQETVFALALREAVTNVVRHAQATVCRLSLRRNGAYCELEVADNGRGGSADEGSGLSGMRERVEALGGVLEREASDGTCLRIRVPV